MKGRINKLHARLVAVNLSDVLPSVPLLSFRCPHPQDPSTMAQAWLSGFLVAVDDQKLIVTAAHFPNRDRSRDFEAQFTDPPMKIALSLAIHRFEEAGRWDVAVLRVNDPASIRLLKPLKVAEDTTFSVGDDVYIAGYPMPDKLQEHYDLTSPLLVVKKGVVASKLAGTNRNPPFIILDTIWDVGMSGGPVIHACTGNVIGVVSSRPQIDNIPLEIVASPSGDQILGAIREHL